jgi:YkoY family integral membrane protein
MFGQTFDARDLIVIGLLVVLEGVLSIDNALVLGLLAKRLPKRLQGKALTYGLVGAFVFRIIAIATATYLLRWRVVKLLGGGYLVYVSIKHFFFDAGDPEREEVALRPDGMPVVSGPTQSSERGRSGFWATVAVIEFTDIAFAVDSILAAIALVGGARPGASAQSAHPKLWVVITGGMLGVILMRFAAVLFIRLLERFPRFETSAYLLVIVIGLKLLADWALNSPAHPHRMDFHDFHEPEFWIFWVLMLACFSLGFLPRHDKKGFPVKIVESPPQPPDHLPDEPTGLHDDHPQVTHAGDPHD